MSKDGGYVHWFYDTEYTPGSTADSDCRHSTPTSFLKREEAEPQAACEHLFNEVWFPVQFTEDIHTGPVPAP